jgi:hypothetical protein
MRSSTSGSRNLLVSGSAGFNLMYSQWLIRLPACGKYTKKRRAVKRFLGQFLNFWSKKRRV